MRTFKMQLWLTENFGSVHCVITLVGLHHVGKFPLHGATHSKRLCVLCRSLKKDAFIGACGGFSRVENDAVVALRTRVKDFGKFVLLAEHGKVFLV